MNRNFAQYYDSNTFLRVLKLANKRSDFYKRIFADSKINLNRIKGLGQINLLPITTAEELRKHPLDFLVTSPKLVKQVVSSSGSTGYPKISFITTEDNSNSFNTTSDELIGIKKSDTIAMLVVGQDSSNFLAPERWRKQGINIIQIESTLLDTQPLFIIDFLKKAEVNILRSSPNQIYRLTLAAINSNIDLKKVGVKKIILSGSSLTANFRSYCSLRWGAEIFASYGCNEIGNLATECRVHNGLHINLRSVFLETVDLTSNFPPQVPKPGKVLITTLGNNQSVILLRYEIGDIGIICDGKCPCGIRGPKIWPLGRTGEVVVIGKKQTAIYPYMVMDVLKDYSQLSGRFAFVMEGNRGENESMVITLETLEIEIHNKAKLLEEVRKKIIRLIPNLEEEIQAGVVGLKLNTTPPYTLLPEWGRKPQSLLIDKRT